MGNRISSWNTICPKVLSNSDASNIGRKSEKSSEQNDRSSRGIFYMCRSWTLMTSDKYSCHQNSWKSKAKTGKKKTINRDDCRCERSPRDKFAAANRNALSGAHIMFNPTLYNYDANSQGSMCSCSICQQDDGFSSGCDSDLFGTVANSDMAPNSEDSMGADERYANKAEDPSQEKLRPPMYNPEDYAASLKKWSCRKPPATSSLRGEKQSGENGDGQTKKATALRDYRNPMLQAADTEMTLKQFTNVTELLTKLKADLKTAYLSFVQEFVEDPIDGVYLILDLLRSIQQVHSSATINTKSLPNPKSATLLQRRAQMDELFCLQCLHLCCQRYTQSVLKLTSCTSPGLFTLAQCIMSNTTKSRILSLELLTKALQNDAHDDISEAMSTLRLRFSEPVRFGFLVGMLTSTGGQGDLLLSGLKFLNTLLDSASSAQKRIYIQAELQQAGLDVGALRKSILPGTATADEIHDQLDHWDKRFLNMEMLQRRLVRTERENDDLRDRVLLLERRIQILQEEKGILINLDQCLKEKCSELQEEMHSLKSSDQPRRRRTKMTMESPPEDEGISSSDRSLTPNHDQRRNSSATLDFYASTERSTLPLAQQQHILPTSRRRTIKPDVTDIADEETTIEEVMEELHSIVESQTMSPDSCRQRQRDGGYLSEGGGGGAKLIAKSEQEIVPSNLLPQPPRRARSLMHLLAAPLQDNHRVAEFFFENDTNFSSDNSDSLLSNSRLAAEDLYYASATNQCAADKAAMHRNLNNTKSKSLDRMGDGLENMVDIVVTDHKIESNGGGPTSAVAGTASPPKGGGNQRHFLPTYYFPRVLPEKKSASFLIPRHTSQHRNAGLYSDRNRASFTPTTSCMNINNRTYGSTGKVTDFPSGLY